MPTATTRLIFCGLILPTAFALTAGCTGPGMQSGDDRDGIASADRKMVESALRAFWEAEDEVADVRAMKELLKGEDVLSGPWRKVHFDMGKDGVLDHWMFGGWTIIRHEYGFSAQIIATLYETPKCA